MGHRDALLAGARQCLTTKGYARTTARDIVAASGANLGSIGYHFGSKDALMNEALMQATGEWSRELEKALTTDVDPAAGRLDRLAMIWDRIITLIHSHKGLWAAQFEMLTQIHLAPEKYPFATQAQAVARDGLATLLKQVDPSLNRDESTLLARFCLVVMTGLMAQVLTDARSAPSGRELAEAVLLIAEPHLREQQRAAR
ncbi:TetR/AcrR family transcriptional regulator [Rhizomonospora bruguierae]|uniref:TetR/AcrR family transcriptional regulator n=1 Tax=Rhizomonospora bruguierae TaxID=1581705 RepID=UPI001BCC8F6D|nr:TetR/AcrR family transcriptional regulator [Micromonospora sp. NBRC 107566]